LFSRRDLMTYSPGWPQTMVLPISASQVAGITDLSPGRPAHPSIFLVHHFIAWNNKIAPFITQWQFCLL
jgi:hypothetical protein